MLVFLLDCLHFNKLLESLPSVWCNFSNLLNASNPAGKQASCAAGFSMGSFPLAYQAMKK